MTILGNLIAVLGVILISLGVFGAARAISSDRGHGFAVPSDTLAEVLKAVPALIDSLSKAPKWLSMILLGIFLVWAGFRLSVPAWPFA